MNTRTVVILTLLALCPALAFGIMKRIDQTITFGPVALHEGARFEVCANMRFVPEPALVQARFVRVRDGASVAARAELEPGRGGCFSVGFEQAGDEPIFATLETLEVPGGLEELDLVTSAAVINGIFESPRPQLLEEDRGLSTATTFGPLAIPEGKRVEFCAHNLESRFPTPLVINYYLAEQTLEPALSRALELEPGRGDCVSLEAERTRGRAVLIEVVTDPVEPGFSNPLPVMGAFIINGIFEAPLPPDLRFLDE